MNPSTQLLDRAAASLAAGRFVKLTLAKPKGKPDAKRAKAIYFRPVELKGELQLQLTYRFQTRDETHNHLPAAAWDLLRDRLGTEYLQADLFTLDEQLTVRVSRKGKESIHQAKARHQKPVITSHNRQKQRLIGPDRPYLQALGVTSQENKVLAKARDKYRQINKFVEIIDGLVRETSLPERPKVVDMGAGSGYLTFALYDLLRQGFNPLVTGVEIRPDLVTKGNRLAEQVAFSGLSFVEGYIGGYELKEVDLLIALHACDTATDDAIHQGIQAGAQLIVVAPCCHKQVRRATEVPTDLNPLLRHGILLERQSEMLTDAIRALVLEARGYKTKVFEFIPLEHTAKNVMITAQRSQARPAALDEARDLMRRFGIQRHYLLDLLTD